MHVAVFTNRNQGTSIAVAKISAYTILQAHIGI